MKRSYLLMLALFMGLVFILSDVPVTVAEEESGDYEFTLEEITVTAQKREENLQKVALDIQTISGAEMTEGGMKTIEDVLKKVSSVIVFQNGDELNVSMRGMDNDNPGVVSTSMVSMTVDGSSANTAGLGASLYDMERVEVLSGPQGTLYSQASSGGVVNLITANPKIAEYEGSGSIEYGNYNLLSTNGMVNAPVTDNTAMRLAFSTTVRDGYVSNDTDDSDTKSARLKYNYVPSDNLDFVLGTEYTKSGGYGQGEGVTIFEEQDGDEDVWVYDVDNSYYSYDNEKKKIYMNMNLDLGLGELTFIPSYTKDNLEQSQPSTDMDGNIEGSKVTTRSEKETAVDLRMASNSDSNIKWLGAFSYYNRKMEEIIYDADGDISSYQLAKLPNYAFYANVTVPVTDRFRATAGGRETVSRTDSLVGNADSETGELVFNSGNTGGNTRTDHFDYKLGVEYDLSENTMLWSDYSTGFRSGNSADETVKSYQLGSKSRFLDEKLQMNTTVFYYDYSGYQVREVGTYYDSEGDSQMAMGEGGGDAEILGIDIDSSYILTSSDRLNLAVSYLHTEIGELTIEYDNDVMDPKDFSGGELNNSPEWTIVAGYEHLFTLPNGGSLTAKVDTRYETEQQLSFMGVEDKWIPDGMDGDKVNTEPTHHISNASLMYNNPDGKWSLNGYINNIENHAKKNGISTQGIMRISSPRTYGAILSIRF